MKIERFQPARKPPTPEENDQKLKDVAKLYEKQFLREMVKAMRGSVQESGFLPANQAEKIFKEQLDDQYVEKWGDQGGVGFQKIIYDQLIEKYGAMMGIKTPPQRPVGPIPLDEKSNFQGKIISSAPQDPKLRYAFERPALASNKAVSLKAPWSGKLMKSTNLQADEYLLDVMHNNGLKSQFVFKGLPNQNLLGQDFEAGDDLGLLSPQAKALFWNVEIGQKSATE